MSDTLTQVKPTNRQRFLNGEPFKYKSAWANLEKSKDGNLVKHHTLEHLYTVHFIGATNVEIFTVIFGVTHEVVIQFKDMVFKGDADNA